jgi:hypothetical protein
MSAHQTKKIINSIGLSLEVKRKKNIKKVNEVSIHLCSLCCEQATEIGPDGLQTRFINCKLGYLTDGTQMRHRDNDKAICRVCGDKLKSQQNKCPNKNMKYKHCPFCRSHDPLAKPPVLCRMPRKKKPFAEAEILRIQKLNKEFKKEKLRRKQFFNARYGYICENEIMNERKFRPLKKYNEEIKRKKSFFLQNKIRLPRRRN